MIFIRLRHLAVILLVLLFVVSAMGGSNDRYRYFASASNSGVCLSFKHGGNLTDCCNKDDHLQRFYVTKTGPSTGIFHTENLTKILCYDDRKGKFKLMKRRSFARLDALTCRDNPNSVRRVRHRRKHKKRSNSRRSASCPFSARDKEILKNPRGSMTCVLHETLRGGYTYISVEEKKKYLAVRGGRVQKLMNKKRRRREPRSKNRQFMVMSEENVAKITNRACVH
ncbi:uncharacterized protein LOC121868091 [Homarus americanus]|uniref:uncharacterized protein LOC121868091 n=1 Tax=Homarus americanus TaxID=6706 RepID=UPI001C4393C8|nr:uncharacterized protein LOC121868091 [Homarus americanus]